MRQQSGRNISNVTTERKSSDNALFQLPSLPTWRTPRIKTQQDHTGDLSTSQHYKNSFTTPLRKPSSLLLYHSQQIEPLPEDNRAVTNAGSARLEYADLPERVSQNSDTEYDYSCLSDKPLLCQSKADCYLHSERAAHCLVFHKDGHPKGIDSHCRPDLNITCGEMDKPTTGDEDYSDSILLHVPGCTKQDMDFLLKRDYMSQRPNIRRIDEILNHEANALSRFWNDSELTKTLDRNHLHEQYLILQQERKELDLVKASLQPDTAKILKNKWSKLHCD
ncbi:hypothetical protein HG535_0G04150 [Zygotorulaspora mrakii]|uniref:Uncharacterized protein n=1 Tax=Zygotorulaspora mrakii TaxID=42260 RepID=A0A7H9B9Y7_ZYGMR|nr:uncharacterized protein HG535_0G04150 [Zygotorulaspora mrakii]QLG74532.1 hypothetical protein HG535_0G04150 [Zygotorulaspora mrakii]